MLKGTRTPIRAVVELWKWGHAPEQIVEHLAHLTLAQAFDALSYFVDHKHEIERHIKENPSARRNRLENSHLSLYFDENVSIKIVVNLRNRGFDVLTTQGVDGLGASNFAICNSSRIRRPIFYQHIIRCQRLSSDHLPNSNISTH